MCSPFVQAAVMSQLVWDCISESKITISCCRLERNSAKSWKYKTYNKSSSNSHLWEFSDTLWNLVQLLTWELAFFLPTWISRDRLTTAIQRTGEVDLTIQDLQPWKKAPLPAQYKVFRKSAPIISFTKLIKVMLRKHCIVQSYPTLTNSYTPFPARQTPGELLTAVWVIVAHMGVEKGEGLCGSQSCTQPV